METKKTKMSCECSSGDYLVIACSGACDLGQITDIVARKLRDNNIRKMKCLATVGAGIKPNIEEFKTSNLLVLDGCAVDCGKKMLDSAGVENYSYMRMTDFGYVKGQTPVTDAIIKTVYEKTVVDY